MDSPIAKGELTNSLVAEDVSLSPVATTESAGIRRREAPAQFRLIHEATSGQTFLKAFELALGAAPPSRA